ncbi:ABC transporter permease [Actinacidiphila yeochonensis]|uniref:ABC transporter permease n=1 Tax=Actinacidiphila yeochonensis TaxID=89050 RepID=UPI00099DC74D|nr:ABC transporter permease [Actinacidiphila yeochonensis]
MNSRLNSRLNTRVGTGGDAGPRADAWTATPAGGAPRASRSALYHPTVARLTARGLLGRRALPLGALVVLLLVVVAAVRAIGGADDGTAEDVLRGFVLSPLVPLAGVIVGTGAIGPEIEDGSIVYLLSKPVRRGTIITTKLLVAVALTLAATAVPTLVAGFVLNGNGQDLAVSYAVSAAVASVAYSAVFLLLAVVTRHAVVAGLVYALVWETLIGSLVPGARTLSVQQWALAVGARAARGDLVSSAVSLPTAVVLLLAVTVGATWYAARRLRVLKPVADE